jgi:MOSC domain-containing protein YiiM
MGTVHSVNVGAVRVVEHGGKQITTGIFKEPVTGRVAVRDVNLAGDDQADREAHGGPVRAVYGYGVDDYAWWSSELGRELLPGTFGENLTVAGIDPNAARIGEQWRIGSVVLQVTSPRVPCYKLAMKMGDPRFVKRFAQSLRPGAYFAIVEEGELAAGDVVDVVSVPSHDITIAEMARIYFFEHDRLRELLVPEMPPNWTEWVEEQLAGN